MTKQTLNSQGFSVSMVILVLVTIATLAGGGWYVMHRQDTNNSNGSSVRSHGSGEDSTGSPHSSTSDPSEGGKYLVLSDVNARIPLSADQRGDLLTDVRTTPGSIDIYFASKKLNELLGDNTCGFVPQPNGGTSPALEVSLHRIEPDIKFQSISKGPYEASSTFIKKAGKYEYWMAKDTKPEINCLTNTDFDGKYNDQLNTIVEHLNQSLANLEVTSN